jgi:hypothetical protein
MYPDLMRHGVAWRLKAYRDTELRGYLMSLHSLRSDVFLRNGDTFVWRLRPGLAAAVEAWWALSKAGDVLIPSGDPGHLLAQRSDRAARVWPGLRGWELRREVATNWRSPLYEGLEGGRRECVALFEDGRYVGLDRMVTRGDD